MDLTHFDEHGYQVVDHLFSDDMLAPVRSFLDDEREASLADVRKVVAFDEPEELYDLIRGLLADRPRFEALPASVRSILSGHYRLEARLSPILQSLTASEPLRSLLGRIFEGRALRMHMPPMARFVVPGNDFAGVPAHQDVSYNKHVGELVTVWVPLSAIDERCGGVAVFHGSGHATELPTRADGDFWLEAVATEGWEKRHVIAQPGQALLLNAFIVHESMPNRSDRVRTSIDMRFFAAPTESDKHYLDLSTGEVIAPRGE